MPKPSFAHLIDRRERLVDIILPTILEWYKADLINPMTALQARAAVAAESVKLAQALLTEEDGRPVQ